MIVAGGAAAAVLEAVDEALYAVAQGVDGAVDGVLHAAVLFGWTLRRAAARTHVFADCGAVVATIGQPYFGIGVLFGHQIGITAFGLLAVRIKGVFFGHQIGIDGAVVGFA